MEKVINYITGFFGGFTGLVVLVMLMGFFVKK